jgi:uncharacterized protein YciI
MMRKHHLVFLKKGPQTGQPREEGQKIQMAHLRHLRRLLDEGRMAAAGPMMVDHAFAESRCFGRNRGKRQPPGPPPTRR